MKNILNQHPLKMAMFAIFNCIIITIALASKSLQGIIFSTVIILFSISLLFGGRFKNTLISMFSFVSYLILASFISLDIEKFLSNSIGTLFTNLVSCYLGASVIVEYCNISKFKNLFRFGLSSSFMTTITLLLFFDKINIVYINAILVIYLLITFLILKLFQRRKKVE